MQGAQTESRFRGIGRYTLSLTKAIICNRGEHEIILVLNGLFLDTIEPIRADFDGLLPQENIRVWYAPGPVNELVPGNEWRREVAELIRESFLASLQPDVILVSSLFEGYVDDAVTSVGVFDKKTPVAVILYDLIPLLNKKDYLEPNPVYAEYYIRKIENLKLADKLLAISESTAKEGISALNLPSDRVSSISTACDDIFKKRDYSSKERLDFINKFGCTDSFILYSGGADSRKNLHNLIKAYAGLSESLLTSYKLVLAGKIPEGNILELRRFAKTVGVSEKQLIFTGYVTDNDLVCFYNLCAVFVFPSMHEGFGLPALEAMSCGAPVIGSACTSIPEVIDMKEALFDPKDVVDMSNKISLALTDSKFRSKLITNGLKQSKKFSWDESARRAILALEKLSPSKINNKKEETEELLLKIINRIADLAPSNISLSEKIKIAESLSYIKEGDYKKQLFIDISELVQRDSKSGVQRVTRSILKELLENPPAGYTVAPIYATMERNGYYYAHSFKNKFLDLVSDEKDELINYNPGDIFLGLDLNHHKVICHKDYLAKLRLDGVKVYFVIYDLLPILIPNAFHPQLRPVHEEWLRIIAGFDGAICISQAVANEITDWYKDINIKTNPIFRVGWFHLGADVDNSVPSKGMPDNAESIIRELEKHPTFLAVGTIEPRKGQAQILSAFELLWKQRVKANLVIVGKQGWMVESLVQRLRDHPKLNEHLFWLEGASDEFLEKIYARSTCLIAASEGEGFGLPLIEASRYKLPIIARDIPVFREVAHDYAFYFKGSEPKDLSKAISDWLKLYKAGKYPQSIKIPWLTWKQSTKQLLDNIIPSYIGYDKQESVLVSAPNNYKKLNFNSDKNYLRRLMNKVTIYIIHSRFRVPLKKVYYGLRLNKIKI